MGEYFALISNLLFFLLWRRVARLEDFSRSAERCSSRQLKWLFKAMAPRKLKTTHQGSGQNPTRFPNDIFEGRFRGEEYANEPAKGEIEAWAPPQAWEM